MNELAGPDPGHRRVMVATVAIGMTTLMQLYYPQALIPAVGRDFAVDPSQAALTVSGATIGLAVAALGWSWIGDRIGQASAMKIAVAVAAAIGLMLPFVSSFPVLVLFRVVQGIALGGAPALALAYVSEQVDRRHALAASATYISGTVVGGLMGRLIAAPIADVSDWRVAALVTGCVSAVGATVAVLALPRDHRSATARPRPTGMRHGMVANLTNPAQLALYAQAFLLMGAQVAIYNYLGYRLELEPFNLPPALTAVIFLAGLSGVLSARMAATFAGRFGRRRILLASSLTMVTGAALTIPDWLPSVLAGLLVFTTAYFAAHSIASGWVGPTATSGIAQATSLYTLFYYAGSSLFGWLGGLAFMAGWTGTASMVMAIVLIAFATARTLLPHPAEEVGPRTPTKRYAAPR
ncbi:MAG: MFS transporter [Nocardioides sp.]|uniref:MFS transporter n=1 Tax=Nocardioides sp. TaxID=35761 RepID=UPI003D6B6672